MANTKYEFLSTVKGLSNLVTLQTLFSTGIVKVLNLYGKLIYLWLNAKGDVHYCFTLYDKEYFTTSALKLGSVLTSHFGCQFEVVNSEKDHLKKFINATAGLNKSLSDSERQNYFTSFNQSNPVEVEYNNTENLALLENIGVPIHNETLTTQYPNTLPQMSQQNPLHNQDSLYESSIQLSTYYLESHMNTTYIKISELPLVHKEVYAPNTKLAFFLDKGGMSCRNSFIATEHMVKTLSYCDPEQSFIMNFIFYMANNSINEAMKILAWVADGLTTLNKVSFALVLYSKDDIFMRLFFDEILAPLFNSEECEKIESDSLDKKSLSDKLDEKIIYNFHNITAPTILGERAYELTNSLIYKEKQKLNNKTVTTVGNVLITSTTNYIPLVSEDVPTATVNVSSTIEGFCKEYSLRPIKHVLAQKIQNDLDNFVSVIRTIDHVGIYAEYQIFDHNFHDIDIDTDILDGNVDPVEVFDKLIRDKDKTPFQSVASTKKDEKLVDELESNFQLNRVDKAHLRDYFEILFGKGMYQSNTAFIKVLRNDYSTTGEPFDDYKSHVRNGRAYYFL